MNFNRLLVSSVLLFSATAANSASIYKCTSKDKGLVFTDKPCPAESVGEIIYTEPEKEIQRRALTEKISNIKRLINNNQADAAKEYALKNNLSEVYRKQLAVYLNEKAEQEKQNAEQDKQQQIRLQQQALALQQQQLELQKQQMALDKAKQEQQQQLMNNQPYYLYARPYHSAKDNCQRGHNAKPCSVPPQPKTPQLSSGHLNPPSSGGLNPPPLPKTQQPNPPISAGLLKLPPK